MKEADFKVILRPHSRTLRQLRLNLEFFLEDVGNLVVYSMTERLKTYDSANRKSHRLNIPIESLEDLAGLRCVVATGEEVEVLSRFLYRMEYSKEIKIEKDASISRKNGYRARHFIITMPGRYERSIFEGKVEVQLLTIFQHAFNFISRAWIYKENHSLGEDWHHRFQALSRQLELLETETNELQKIIIGSSISDKKDEPLTPMSVKFISKSIFGEDVSIDEAVDSCRAMVDLGCDTNGKFRQFLNRQDIADFRDHLRLLLQTTEGDLLGLLTSFLDMPTLTFWMFFGPRMHVSYEFIEKLSENNRKKHN